MKWFCPSGDCLAGIAYCGLGGGGFCGERSGEKREVVLRDDNCPDSEGHSEPLKLVWKGWDNAGGQNVQYSLANARLSQQLLFSLANRLGPVIKVF